MVNVPKTKKTYCKNKERKKHTLHKMTQCKKGKESLAASGKHVMIVNNPVMEARPNLSFTRSVLNKPKPRRRLFRGLSAKLRCKHFEIGGDKKGKGTSLF